MTSITRAQPRYCAPQKPAPKGLLSLIALWRQRQQLRHLDARALEDMGITPEAAHREATRPVWDVPPYWRR